jgi:hypothetical protein
MTQYRIVWFDQDGIRHATAPRWRTLEAAERWRKRLLRDSRVRLAAIEAVTVRPAA